MASVAQTTVDEASTPEPSTLRALWRSVTHIDKGKVNSPYLALRNALAVAVPLAAGIALGNSAAGAAVATGALNVSYSDGSDPYPLRARRMITWSVLGAIAVFSGSAAGPHHWIAILLTAAWAFLAGLLLSISTRAGDLGLNTLVALIVFSARGPSGAGGALDAALLVLGGGLLQTAVALLFWPVHKYDPERRAIGSVFAQLANAISSAEEEALADPLAALPDAHVQDALTSLSRDHSLEGERLRLLFDQADRVRLSAFLLRRLQSLFADQSMSANTDVLVKSIDRVFENASLLVGEVATDLSSDKVSPELQQYVDAANSLAKESESAAKDAGQLSDEIRSAIGTFTGQLRAVASLASRSTFEAASEMMLQEDAQPWRLQLQNWVGTLVANFNLSSPSFRHGLRMAVFVALADAISRGLSWQRTYWLPMTVAVILKPDFTTTISRGVLRLAGTLTGLVIATGLYHAIPSSAFPELILVAIFAFGLRMYGPANYGIFSVAITGLIVFLIAAIGTPPRDVVVQRGLNTVAGGLLALIAYGIWPTWERRRIPDVMADMMDAIREYLRAVVTEFGRADKDSEAAARKARIAFRRARSKAEASVDHVAAEPKMSREKLLCLNSMLASSHALVHAVMGLEAGLLTYPRKTVAVSTAPPKERRVPFPASGRACASFATLTNPRKTVAVASAPQYPEALRSFAHDVEFTLYYLAALLRGSGGANGALPKLRAAHQKLVEESGAEQLADDYILTETDRIVVAANTLREKVSSFANA